MQIQDFLVTVLLGVVEGVTEYLPISSTAHLLITEYYLGAKTDAFNIIIQSGAVMAVVLIYWKRLLDLAIHFRAPEQLDYILKLSVAFGITVIGGLTSRKMGITLPEELTPIAMAMLVGAGLIFLSEWILRHRKATDSITWSMAAWIGMAQVLAAVFPGTSRSGATIIAAMMCGLTRPAATEFSFLLGIPTMMAASVYAVGDAVAAGAFDSRSLLDLLVGFSVSLVTAFIVVKWLISFVQTNTFIPFAWYRAIMAGVLFWLMWQEDHRPPDLAALGL